MTAGLGRRSLMKLRTMVLGLGFILLAALVSSPSLAAQPGDATAGKAIYTKSCAGCHGATGEPKEALAKALKVEMRQLGSKEVLAKSDAELRKDVLEGIGKMKPVKGLSDQDLANLIAYMRGLAEK
jgi:mono/diheme cytochrome c family protein